MKYMVPEINISRFSLENIVTDSAINMAKAELAKAGVMDTNTVVTNFNSIEDWVAQN